MIKSYAASTLLLLLTTSYVAAQATPSDRTNDDQYGYARVTPSMAIIIVVLIAALFFMGFFSIYIRHCTDASNSVRPVGAANGRSRRGAASRGLDASVINTFPALVYSEVKGLKIGKGALECAVCLSEFEDDETLRFIPKCDHVFHLDCIDAWLASHTTCPVCRANLTPQPDDPVATQPLESLSEPDLEAQTEAVELEPEASDHERTTEVDDPKPNVLSVSQTLNRNRTRGRGSRSGRQLRFPRSHSTGHSLVQPGENTERFTLRLPNEVRKQIMNRELDRTMSMVVFSRERSSRRGYRFGGEGSSRGKNSSFKRLEPTDEKAKSDRWAFNLNPSFLTRASSFLTRASSSVRSPKIVANDGEGTSTRPAESKGVETVRPPV